MNLIQELEKEQIAKLSAGKEIPDFAPGDTVLVNVKVVEGERTRIQAYEGICIGRAGAGLNENFTVRKISYGEGVERVFPLYSPMIDSIKVVRRGKVGAPRPRGGRAAGRESRRVMLHPGTVGACPGRNAATQISLRNRLTREKCRHDADFRTRPAAP